MHRHRSALQLILAGGVLIGAVVLADQTSARLPTAKVSFDFEEVTIDGVHAALKSGQVTCRGLIEHYLQRIKRYDKAGPALNAVQNINPHALEEADRRDAVAKAGTTAGPLHCIPILVKDQVETTDMPTTYGSAVFQDFIPKRDATIITRLKNAGAIILGKNTMGEFANGYVGSAFGIARNAYDLSRVPSGSSSGTGSSIAANFAVVGIAEDTGGSTRGPAAVNNLVGLRPTLQLVSRHGMMPATPTRDTLGPVTRTVRDAAMVLDVIAGYDPNDPITAYAYGEVPATYAAFLDVNGLHGARIGVIREPMDTNADTTSDDYRKVRAVTDRAIADLKTLGAQLVDPLAIPGRRERPASPAGPGGGASSGPAGRGRSVGGSGGETEEAINAYLGEHDNAPVKTLRDILLTGKVSVKRARELMGTLGRSTAEIGYLQTMLGREASRQTWLKLMADHQLDAVVYATFDHQPALIPEDILTNPNSGEGYGRGSNRSLSPTLGFPAMTVPAGFTVDGLPVGLEFLGRPFAEATLFKLAYAYEQGTGHRKPSRQTPPLSESPDRVGR